MVSKTFVGPNGEGEPLGNWLMWQGIGDYDTCLSEYKARFNREPTHAFIRKADSHKASAQTVWFAPVG